MDPTSSTSAQAQATFTALPLNERKIICSTSQTSKQSQQIRVAHSNQIPSEILNDDLLNESILTGLPKNYNFEIHKTIARIVQIEAKLVLLQFPEGLIRFGPVIVDIMTSFFAHHQQDKVRFITMGDLTYGACCIDDYLATSLGCDLIVHYAHSCLVPINQLSKSTKYLYVFLDIKFNIEHLLKCVQHNFKPDIHKIALASTIQFVHSVHELAKHLKNLSYHIVLPQSHPLSPAEVLGCTAPKLDSSVNAIIFVCDGRFHLEALMISNPSIEAFRYDPYSKKLTKEEYNFELMLEKRQAAIDESVECMKQAKTFGFVLGTLGRQGNEKVFETLVDQLKSNTKCKFVKVMMPEVTQQNLEAFGSTVDVWVQVACPRLSIDWGSFFAIPLLNPFEYAMSIKKYASTKLGADENYCNLNNKYPMDFYAKHSCGNHTPNHVCVGNPYCQCQN